MAVLQLWGKPHKPNFTPYPIVKPMTAILNHYLTKRFLYNLLPFMENKNIEVPLSFPLLDLLSASSGASITCGCCGWKGQEMKAKKHYLVVGKIAELELFCPKCNHYMGFLSEPVEAVS
jgi:hypothetical protein